jgi:hypothetical protein
MSALMRWHPQCPALMCRHTCQPRTGRGAARISRSRKATRIVLATISLARTCLTLPAAVPRTASWCCGPTLPPGERTLNEARGAPRYDRSDRLPLPSLTHACRAWRRSPAGPSYWPSMRRKARSESAAERARFGAGSASAWGRGEREELAAGQQSSDALCIFTICPSMRKCTTDRRL